MSINEKLSEIQRGLAVPKGQRNDFGKYAYRSAEDVLHAVKPLLGGLTLITNTEMVAVGDRVYVKCTAIIRDDSESASASGYAREPLSRKGMDESQITGAATSYAKKYALGNLFAIDNEKDADTMPPPQPFTDEQQLEFTGIIEKGTGLGLVNFIERHGREVYTALYNSATKDKMKFKAMCDELYAEGSATFDDIAHECKIALDMGDAEGFKEQVSDLSPPLKKLLTKQLTPEHMAQIKAFKS